MFVAGRGSEGSSTWLGERHRGRWSLKNVLNKVVLGLKKSEKHCLRQIDHIIENLGLTHNGWKWYSFTLQLFKVANCYSEDVWVYITTALYFLHVVLELLLREACDFPAPLLVCMTFLQKSLNDAGHTFPLASCCWRGRIMTLKVRRRKHSSSRHLTVHAAVTVTATDTALDHNKHPHWNSVKCSPGLPVLLIALLKQEVKFLLTFRCSRFFSYFERRLSLLQLQLG